MYRSYFLYHIILVVRHHEEVFQPSTQVFLFVNILVVKNCGLIKNGINMLFKYFG